MILASPECNQRPGQGSKVASRPDGAAPSGADGVAARTGRIREERRKALLPQEHRHVIDLDAALGQQFLEVAIGEDVARRYQRTAKAMISGGNRKPLKAELGTATIGRRRELISPL